MSSYVNNAIFAAVMAGAAEYLLKEVRGSSLIDGIRQVAAGRSLLDPSVTEQLLTRPTGPTSGAHSRDSNTRAAQRR